MNGPSSLQADPLQIGQFVSTLFRYADEGSFISLRGFDQVDRGIAPILIQGVPVPASADFTPIIEAATQAANRVANNGRPGVFAPPVATFTVERRARTEDLANGVALSVELDGGDCRAALSRLESIIGPATIVTASGGEWTDPATGEIHPRQHFHWRLSEPTRTSEEHETLRQTRVAAAMLVGGDMTAGPPAHPLRWPGSWNLKKTPRLSRIVTANDGAEIHLADALEKLQLAIEAAGLGTEPDAIKASGPPQAPLAHVAAAVAAIPNNDVSWDDWNRLGMAMYRATGGDEAGLAAWDDWSAKSPKHNGKACKERWKHFGTSKPTKIGAGTIFMTAAAAGWDRAKAFPPEPPEQDAEDPWHEQEAAAGSGGRTRSRANVGGDQKPGAATEPVDFFNDAATGGAPVLRQDHVPDALWPFIIDTAERMGVDPATVALGALVCCASVVSDEWKVQPKRHDYTWAESARLWGAIIGDPGTLKSPIVAACTKPIEKLGMEARKRHADEMREWRRLEAEAKAEKIAPPPQPKLDRFMVESATPEALSEVLRDDDEAKMRVPCGKVLVRQDEMSEFFAGLDKYKAGGKGGSERGAYLRLYNGGRYTVDRIGRGSFDVPNWSATFIGGVQPGPIQKIAQDAADDGMLQRFIKIVPDKHRGGLDRSPDQSALARYASLFPVMVALQPAAPVGSDHIRPVVFHGDAHAHREEINALAVAMAELPDTSMRMKATFDKWPGTFARLCLTFHMIEIADHRARGEQPPAVQVITERTACQVADFMREIILPHEIRAEALMFSSCQTGHAQWIAGLILSKAMTKITTRDIAQSYRALKAPEARRELDAVMEGLVAVGWLEPEQPDNPVKRVTSWLVNPLVHVRFTARAEAETKRRAEAKERIAVAVKLRRGQQAGTL